MKKDLLSELRRGKNLTTAEMIQLTFKLALPSIIAEVSYLFMSFIDASMVGSLGANASASVGIVATTTWLLGGIIRSATLGFTVQVAHLYGAENYRDARAVVLHGVLSVFVIGLVLMSVALSIAPFLPGWLGGDASIQVDATKYFMIYAFSLPCMAVNNTSGGMLQCSGNMKVPSALNVIACALDVVFNFFLIYPTKVYNLMGHKFTLYRAGMGVRGAALGTTLAALCCAVAMVYFLMVRSENLHFRREKRKRFDRNEITTALQISLPVALQNILSGGAQIVSTGIVAPLGKIAISANSFAVTTEGFCYMPGFGISAAATTMVGQSIGAGRKKTAKKLGWICMISGMVVMGIMGALMYALSYSLVGLLTPVEDIRALGAAVLRIEAFAEPFFAAMIVGEGVFRGFKDTMGPSIIDFATMWVIRLPLAFVLSKSMGLRGVWVAMCIQLIISGAIFLVRMGLKNRNALDLQSANIER